LTNRKTEELKMANQSVILRGVRLSYLFAFKPRVTDKGVEVFQASLIIPKNHPQVDEVKTAIQKTRDESWPDPAKRPNGLKNPLRDGDTERSNDEAYKGAFFIGANRYKESQGAPRLIDAQMQPASPEYWNSGDFANVKVDFFTYNKPENKDVGASLVAIQFLRKGDPLTGHGDPLDGFSKVEEESQTTPQTKAAADFWN